MRFADPILKWEKRAWWLVNIYTPVRKFCRREIAIGCDQRLRQKFGWEKLRCWVSGLQGWLVLRCWPFNHQTSRERPKSAPYLRLKKTRKPPFLQLETTKALKKLKIEKKNSDFFFDFFEVSGKSHSAEKCKKGDALGFFEHPFCCKISKIDGRNNKKISEKNQSHSAEKRRKVS